MKLPTRKPKLEVNDAEDTPSVPAPTPLERPLRTHAQQGATCIVCGTIGTEDVCPVDGYARRLA